MSIQFHFWNDNMEKAGVWQEMEIQSFHLYLFPLEPATSAEAQGFDLHQNFGRLSPHVLPFKKKKCDNGKQLLRLFIICDQKKHYSASSMNYLSLIRDPHHFWHDRVKNIYVICLL